MRFISTTICLAILSVVNAAPLGSAVDAQAEAELLPLGSLPLVGGLSHTVKQAVTDVKGTVGHVLADVKGTVGHTLTDVKTTVGHALTGVEDTLTPVLGAVSGGNGRLLGIL